MRAVDHAWELLAEGLTPQEVVTQLTPPTKPEAVALARRLPLLHERPDADRGAACVRLAARAGMRRFRLAFAPDGRVADDPAYNRPRADPAPVVLPAAGCTVEYVARYFPDRDHFQFLGPPAGDPDKDSVTPRQPIPLSGTGHWSHFAHPDAVRAMGGPAAYIAALLADGPAGAKALTAAFEFDGTPPESKPKPRRPPQPVVGEHTARLVPPAAPAPEPTPAPPGPEAPPRGRLF